MNWNSDSIKSEITSIVIEYFEKMDKLDERHKAGELSNNGYSSTAGRMKNAMKNALLNLRVRSRASIPTGLMRAGVPVMPPEADEGEHVTG